MEATFKIDPCYTLHIRSVGARDVSEPGVHIGLSYKPVGFSGYGQGGVVIDETPQSWHQEKWLSPAEARAIGSAIIGAAVNARE